MEFRLVRTWRIVVYVISVVMIPVFVAGLIWSLIQPDHWIQIFFLAPLYLGLILFFCYVALEARYGKYVFNSTSITYASKFGDRSLLLTEVRGYRVDDKYICIIPNDKDKRVIKISAYTEQFNKMEQFLSELFPGLDISDEIIRDSKFGDTPELRELRLRRAKTATRITNIAGCIITGWVFISPKPYELVLITIILFQVVPLGVAYAFRGLVRINDKKDSPYPSIGIGFILASIGLFLRIYLDFEIETYGALWWYMSATAGILLVSYMFSTREFNPRNVLDYFAVCGIAGVLMAYSCGAITFVNCYYDESVPEVFQTTVADKNTSNGRTTSYYLYLAPWGPRATTERMSVSQQEYESYDVNDQVSVYLKEGTLDAPWFYITGQ